MKNTPLLLLALACAWLTSTAAFASGPTPTERLAAQYTRGALQMLRTQPLTIEMMEVAAILLDEAARMTPNDADLWRLIVELAALRENDADRAKAVERLVQLDPTDDAAKLQRAYFAIERHQTAEDRAQAYRSLLTEPSKRELGPAVASRLAMDLALLERRRGDSRAFAEWLAEAVKLDPSNHAAASLAAGFFRMHLTDPFAEAELLSTVFLANITDINVQVALASHLLEHGAYVGAERIYRFAVSCHKAIRAFAADGVVADLATAQWARGDAAGALRTILDRQRESDARLRNRLRVETPELTSMDVAKHTAHLDPPLATTLAAIHSRLKDGQAADALNRAIQSHESQIASLAQDVAANAGRIALLRLQAAWITLWLGGEPESAEAYLRGAAEFQPLSDAAAARFEGWTMLRRGDAKAAAERLAPYVDQDAPAALGHALAQLELGQQRSAARELLAIARAQPGSLIGVWAADRLAELLGQRVVLTETAAAMERLIARIPTTIDRFAEQPNTAVSIRVVPSKTTFVAYEPLLVNIEIANHAPIPMAIDPNGPIRPQVMLRTSLSAAQSGSGESPPTVVDLGRSLRLMPRERMTIPIDLRRTSLGFLLDQVPATGSMVRVRAILNPLMMPEGALLPGLLGTEVEAPPIRVDGARLNRAWVEDTAAAMMNEEIEIDLPRLAMLSHLAAGQLLPNAQEEDRRIFELTRSALVEAFARLDGIGQAWLLTVMPTSTELDSLLALGRKSDDRFVRIAYLAHRIRFADDPIVRAVRESDDPVQRRLGELITIVVERRAAEAAAAEQRR